jgi:hypothetical protein
LDKVADRDVSAGQPWILSYVFTDKEITAWRGMGLMKRMLDHLGFQGALSSADFPQPGSNRGYAPKQRITQCMLWVWCAANRFEHGELTHHNPVLKRIFGIKRMPNFQGRHATISPLHAALQRSCHEQSVRLDV